MKLAWYSTLLFPFSLWGANTSVLFQSSLPSVGPFPADVLTVATAAQSTGLQVDLPLASSCTVLSSATACSNTLLLNQLDGFSVNPRIKVCFSGPVDTSTLTGGISIMPADLSAPAIGINQVIFDPATNCAYAKPDRVLNQQTHYLMTVTSDINDSSGKRVVADKNYKDCVKKPSTAYCEALSSATTQLVGKGNSQGELVAASLFTTMSATKWLQQARAAVNSGGIPEMVMPAGLISTFSLDSLSSMTWQPQTGVSGVNYDRPLPLNALAGVDRVTFGLFLSPLYLNVSGPQAGSISTTPTQAAIANPTAVISVSFHVFLPPSPPTGKIPVVIYGHGFGDDQFGGATYAASTFAQKGFAVVVTEITGHGFGPASTMLVTTKTGQSYTVPTPGRGIQFSPTVPIGPTDGCVLPSAVATRDCVRQSAVDLFALVRTIRDTGLGSNLDPSRIYFVGQSLGSIYGTLFEAVEPNVSAATLNVGGGTQADIARLSPVARQLAAAYLSTFSPSLLNVPPAPAEAYFHDHFNDEYVYRGQVVTDSVPGALAVQAALEESEWMGMLGDALSFGQHLKTLPLPGVPAKSILIQFGLGDLEIPNPAESQLVRAAGLQQSTWLFRTDLAAALDPRILTLATGSTFPIYPHRFMSNPGIFDPAEPPVATAVAVAAQSQIADFFVSGGATITDPNTYLTGTFAGRTLFQIPAVLPDGLNFLQIKP